MNLNNYIIDLKSIGLLKSEAKVYCNLLRKKDFTASEIAKLSHIPRPKVYEVLEKLIGRGFCTAILYGQGRKYSAVSPEVCFDSLNNEIEKKQGVISHLRKYLLSIYISHREATDPLNYIQVIRKSSIIRKKVDSLARNTEDEMLCFTKGPYIRLPAETEEIFKLIKRGALAQSIFEIEDMVKPDFLKRVEKLAKLGEKVRITDRLPLELMIFDCKKVLFSLENRLASDDIVTAMIIEHSDLSITLKGVFNTYWEKSMTLEEFKTKFKESVNEC